MTVRVTVGQIRVDAAALRAFERDGNGPIMRDLTRRATRVQAGARMLVRKRTRTLEASIVKRPEPFAARGPQVAVTTSVKYALWEHDGTRPHTITPRTKKVLRFPGRGGAIVFAHVVHHPGTKGSHFLTRALPLAGD